MKITVIKKEKLEEYKLNNVFNKEEKEKTLKMLSIFLSSKMGLNVKKLIGICTLEEDFAFNKKLELVDFEDSNAWVRGSADLYFANGSNGFIADYKTGKDKSEDTDFGYTQAMVYAIYMFIKFPEVKNIKALFLFIEHSTKKEIEFNRDYFNSYIKDLYIKTKTVEDDPFFPEKVSPLCQFCDFNDTEFCSAYNDNIKKTEQILSSKVSLDF